MSMISAIVKLASRGEPVSLQVPVFQKRQADASDSSSFGDNTPTVAPAAGAASPSDMASGHRSTPRSKRRKADFVNYASILIQRLFGCSSAAPAGFDVPLPAFINTIMSRTRISVSTLVTAFLYLTRLKSMHPKCKGNEGSAHRLTLAAIVIAAKFIYDDTFDNTAWAAVSSGIFRLEEINNMEMEILHFMGYILFVTDDNYQTFYAAVDREIGLIMVASAPDTDMETAMAATRRLREAQKIAFAAASASSGQTVDIGAIEKSWSLSASKTAVSASTASSTSATEAWACANANAVRPATYPPSSNAAAAYQPASRIPVYNPYTAVSAHASTAVASSMTRTISHADGYHPLQQQSLQQQDVLPFAMVPPPLPKARMLIITSSSLSSIFTTNSKWLTHNGYNSLLAIHTRRLRTVSSRQAMKLCRTIITNTNSSHNTNTNTNNIRRCTV
ncbi:hypothetical protein BC831DRAFT_548208 [Entophlyctis helioformis]|nr:hypothetical protein BC831DRAFT_548208 [Entophlyctis helioformis]